VRATADSGRGVGVTDGRWGLQRQSREDRLGQSGTCAQQLSILCHGMSILSPMSHLDLRSNLIFEIHWSCDLGQVT
jgi:hypothetical protein